jgi:diguanylate cyclase (GGDEF)-like protein
MAPTPAIHPRDRPGASRAVAYLMMAAIPFMVVSVILVPDFLGTGAFALVNVILVIVLLAAGAFVCWRYPRRLPDWFWVGLPVVCAAGIAWMDLVTHDAGVTGQLFFLWPVFYAATFLRRAMVVVVLFAVLVAESVVVLTLLNVQKALSDITGLMTTLTMAAVIIVLLRERRDELLTVLETQALADPLTGLPNRRAFDRDLAHAAAWAKRSGGPLALLTVDVDNFKSVNDSFGHSTGDAVLRMVARALAAVVRDCDIVARLGGDEFVVLLRSGSAGATRVAEALRERVAADPDTIADPPTVSIGIAVLPDHAATVPDLVAASDAALYEAKTAGRNRVACAGPSRPRPLTPRGADRLT